jgi:hypothetical protein
VAGARDTDAQCGAPPPSGTNWASTQPRSNCDQSNARVSYPHFGVYGIIARHSPSSSVRQHPPRGRLSCRNSHHPGLVQVHLPSRQPGTRPHRKSIAKSLCQDWRIGSRGYRDIRKDGAHGGEHRALHNLCPDCRSRSGPVGCSIRIGLQWRHAPVYHLFNLRCCMSSWNLQGLRHKLMSRAGIRILSR